MVLLMRSINLAFLLFFFFVMFNQKVYSLPTNQTNPKSFSEANLLDDDSAVLLKAAAVVVEGNKSTGRLLQ